MTDKKRSNIVDMGDNVALKVFHRQHNDKDIEFRKLCLDFTLRYSLKEAAKQLEELGFLTRNGRRYSVSAIRSYALQYVIHYPEDARRVYQERTGEFGNNPEGEATWIYFVISRALKHFSKGKEYFIRWALRKGLYKKGFRIFQPHFNLRDEDFSAFDYVLGNSETYD